MERVVDSNPDMARPEEELPLEEGGGGEGQEDEMLPGDGDDRDDRGGGEEDDNTGVDHPDEDDSLSPQEQRMILTEDEHNLALNIKVAIASTSHVDPVSDFMCAQLALIDGDDTEAALERAYHVQCFREEYAVLDTAADGRRMFEAFVNLMPGFHLCFSDDFTMGRNVMIYDNTKYSDRNIQTQEHSRITMSGSYYSLVAFCPDFDAIRTGAVIMAECQGYDWKADLDFKSTKKAWTEIGSIYPMTFCKAKYFNAGTTFNLVAAMMRRFLPKNLRDNLELGCQFEQRLDEVYLVPTLEEANKRLVNRVAEALQRRYENERTFRL